MEACSEFNLPLWVCAVDFRKAFDSVEHSSIWKALGDQGVDRPYIRVLAQLYSKQVGYINFGSISSKPFQIQRGTKQGDPLSPALFNSVLEDVMRSIQPTWRRKGYGIALGSQSSEILTNLRFADDLLLLAASEKQVKNMLEDLVSAAQKVGLEIHTGKTKVLSNDPAGKKRTMRVGDSVVDILPATESTEYLGRKLTFGEMHSTEIDARLDKAWRKFMASKTELCGRHVRLTSRLKLFHATVTPTFLYGSGTWTLTAEMERRIQSTQRRMLRWMLGAGRRKHEPEQPEIEVELKPEEVSEETEMGHEPWLEWIIRTTGIVEAHLGRIGLDDWVTAVRRKKWRWAGHLARRDDGRWATKLLTWRPAHGHRNIGRPCRRWCDELDAFFEEEAGFEKGAWLHVAQDRATWESLEAQFVARA